MQRKLTKGSLLFPLTIVLLAGILTSCTDFFTTSWGEWAARDKSTLVKNVTSDNIDELMATAANDKEMQVIIMNNLVDAVSKEENPDKKKKLQNAGVELALSTTNIMDTVLGSVGELTSLMDGGDGGEVDTDEVITYVTDILNSMSNLQGSTDNLSAMINIEDIDNLVDENNAMNMALTSVLLLCAEVQSVASEEKPMQDYFDDLADSGNFDPNDSTTYPEEFQDNPKFELAIKLGMGSIDKISDDSPLASLKDMLEQFGF